MKLFTAFIILISSAAAAENRDFLDSVSKTMTQEEIRIANEGTVYLQQLFAPVEELNRASYAYLRAVIQSDELRSSERKRAELVELLKNTKKFANEFKPFHGDSALVKELFSYLDVTYSIFKEDYDKILDMDQIRERSIDDEEAYEKAVDQASEKQHEVFTRYQEASNAFTSKYKIIVNNEKSALSLKIEKANQLLDYYSKIQRSVNRPHRYYNQAMIAIDQKNVADMEQNLLSLTSFAESNLQKLNSEKPYNGDSALCCSARNYITTLRTVGEKRIQANITFILQAEAFEKQAKKFTAVNPQKRTAAEIDAYNLEVSRYNSSISEINTLNKKCHAEIESAFRLWSKSIEEFLREAS